jgi:hypothetical protein
MESSGAVYARVPAGGLEALEAATAEARAASRQPWPRRAELVSRNRQAQS